MTHTATNSHGVAYFCCVHVCSRPYTKHARHLLAGWCAADCFEKEELVQRVLQRCVLVG
jgi:hypothetical protein